MGRIFAVEFTHEKMTAAFVASDGREEDAAGFDLEDFLAGDSNPLDKLVGLLTMKARAAGGPIAAVALSMPCDLDAERTRVVSFPRASWLNDRPLPEILSAALSLPAVMERRAVVSLFYDRIMLGLPEECLAVGCYVDTHYDSAVWHGGKFLLGRNGAAGNIAHMPIAGREDACFCGKSGCVDLYGAGGRLAQMHSMIFPDTPGDALFEEQREHPIMQDYIAMMALPIAMEANMFDPDFLILGGRIPSMRGFPRKSLEDQVLAQRYLPGGRKAGPCLWSAASVSPGVVCAARYAGAKLGI